MELTQDVIESLIRQKELERLLYKEVGLEQDQAAYLATRLLVNKDKLVDILQAKYKVEVSRVD